MKTQTIDKELFGARLRHLMKSYQETTYSLGAKFNLSPPTISRYSRGTIEPKTTTIKALARYFNVSPSWLAGEQVSMYEREPISKAEGFDTKVPVTLFKRIVYDTPIFSNEKSSEVLNLPMKEVGNWGGIVGYIMPDDSMAPTIDKDDHIIIKINTYLQDGNLTALHVNHNDMIIRKVLFKQNEIILQPHNPKYNSEVYRLSQDDIQIIGSVIYREHLVKETFAF